MMIKRNSEDRGPTDLGWLKSMHSFSFGHYHDPKHMGFGALRVINEDRVTPGAGFGTHPHDNMEIISYVLSGELAHKDSMGSGAVIRAGEIQIMSAGTGVTHSEYNASNDNEVHFLQIWIIPGQRNTLPGYQQRLVDPDTVKNRFAQIIVPEGSQNDTALSIKQNATIYLGRFDAGRKEAFKADPNRKYWLQIVRGKVEIAGQKAQEGDGFAFAGEAFIDLKTLSEAEFLLFNLAA
ncbi:MAG: pirin family protein [Alphaproteobacteria bacterium]|nr:pirin family protein [Alphaproteobacteria bacterium]QQS58149.1 MAG: pirin family protein [Alphaproteobacteria bacterium]